MNRLSKVLGHLALAMMFGQLAHASTIVFASNTATFTNAGGITGLTLTISCGTTAGTSCGDNGAANNNGNPSFTAASGLGVQTRSLAGDTNAMQGFGTTGEFLLFTFTGSTANLRLTGATLSNATTGYVLNGASSLSGTVAANVSLANTLSFSSGNGGTAFTFGTTTNAASFFVSSISFTNATPESSTFALIGLGLVGLGAVGRRRRKSSPIA